MVTNAIFRCKNVRTFIAIFTVKIDENLRLSCSLALFGSRGVEKRPICSSLFSHDLLTTNTSSLVDVEEDRYCELL